MLIEVVSYVLVALLATIALLHLGWALGLSFPCANEQSLARTVVGRRGITKMPSKLATLFVVLCLVVAAYWAWRLGGHPEANNAKWYLGPIGLLIGFVFAARGVIGVLPAFERAMPEQPFLKLNRRFYSPLCLLLGLGFVSLALSLPNWTWRLGEMLG